MSHKREISYNHNYFRASTTQWKYSKVKYSKTCSYKTSLCYLKNNKRLFLVHFQLFYGPGSYYEKTVFRSGLFRSDLNWVSKDFKWANTAQKIKFSIKDFSSKCDQIRRFLRTWSHLLEKPIMENFIFCVVKVFI